jgi:hypothetical protein
VIADLTRKRAFRAESVRLVGDGSSLGYFFKRALITDFRYKNCHYKGDHEG